MEKPTRIALVGVGGVGATHLGSLDKMSNVRLVAVADPAEEALADKKAELESRGVRWHTDYRELLDRADEVDAVVIAAPIPFHFEMASDFIGRGLHVYLEKPPVPLIQQLDELIALDAAGKVSVAFQHISSPAMQELKGRIVRGELGSVREIRVAGRWPRQDRYYQRARWVGRMAIGERPIFDGPASNAMAHLLHDVMFLAGNELESCAAPTAIRGELYRVRPIESYDTICLRGSFKTGVVFTAALTHASEHLSPWRIEVLGTKNRACLFEQENPVDGYGGLRFVLSPFKEAFLESYRDFIDFVQGRRERAVTRLEDTRGFLLATNGALMSSGGIHDIDRSLSRIYRVDGDTGYDMPELPALIERAFKEGLLYSEMGVPWAKKTEAITVQALNFMPFDNYCLTHHE